MVTCTDLENILLARLGPEKIAAIFTDCEGNPRSPGVSIPSCAEMDAAIRLAVCEGCGGGGGGGEGFGDIITSVAWTTTARTTLRISVRYADSTTNRFDVDFSNFLGGFEISDTPPDTSEQIAIPTSRYGLGNILLTVPDRWYIMPGTGTDDENPQMLIPAYTVGELPPPGAG